MSDNPQRGWRGEAQALLGQGRLGDAARLLARHGEIDHAASLYVEAERPLEAARCLVLLERWKDAAELFSSAGRRLPPGTRMQALRDAATCWLQAHRPEEAATLLRELGDDERAEAALAAARKPAVTPTPLESLAPSTQAGRIQSRFEPGQILADRYHLEERIAAGGMAAIYRALDLETNARMALKVLHAHPDDEVAVQMFKRELRLTRRLRHPNVLEVYDFGVASGRCFLTMELLEGEDLGARMARPARLPLERILDWLSQAAAGLQAAHAHGIIHRDVKPENLFLCDGAATLKVMDFGLARPALPSGISLTGGVVGTPEYMAPEQATGDTVTTAADIYALGVVAFELLTRRRPFDGESAVKVMLGHLAEAPPKPTSLEPQLPAEVEALVLSMLEKAPERRPTSSVELVGSLRRLADCYRGLGLKF